MVIAIGRKQFEGQNVSKYCDSVALTSTYYHPSPLIISITFYLISCHHLYLFLLPISTHHLLPPPTTHLLSSHHTSDKHPSAG